MHALVSSSDNTQAVGAILLWTLADMAYPAISSIKANRVAASEQGAMQVR